MTKTIFERTFPPAPPEDLDATHLDPTRHTAVIDAAVTITPVPGSPFTAINGQIGGQIPHLDPGKLIVHTWVAVQLGPRPPRRAHLGRR
jgi:hypothetical protein